MLKIIYCDSCKEKISKFGDIALAIFEQICEEYFNDKPLKISTLEPHGTYGYLAVIRFLEQKGFVVSTECCENNLLVKPLGCEFFEQEDFKLCYFCMHDEFTF